MEELKENVRMALTGPVCSIPTPFTTDDEIDYDTTAKMIDFQIDSGFKMIFLTPGNSHYNSMTEAEMTELCRFTVNYTRKRVLVCVTEYGHIAKRTFEFARFARECGADLFLPYPCNWAGSVDSGSLGDYYVETGKIIPLMLIFSPLGGTDAGVNNILDTIERTDAVVAIKDDSCNAVSRRLAAAVGDRVAVFAGGQKQNFLNIMPYGASGYLSTLGMFRPDLAWDFWRACEQKDFPSASAFIRNYDWPYFDLISRQPGGFDAGIKATLELFGFGSRRRRAPYRNLNDGEMECFRQSLEELAIFKKEKPYAG